MKKLLLLAAVVLGLASCMSVPLPPGSVFLGDRTVPFSGDHNVVTVGNYQGFFRSILFTVEQNDIEIYNVVIVYGNGEKENISTRLAFDAGTRSRVIDLQGGKRRIRNIQFSYKTVGSWLDGRAHIIVYGVR